MKNLLALIALVSSTFSAHAEYDQVKMIVFGMDCAPCAHAIHVSMKGIRGVEKVDVDLNSGLVSVQLAPGNSASMQQFNQAVEKNGFTHKDAKILAKGTVTGTPTSAVLEVSGTSDRYALTGGGANLASLIGKTVSVSGSIPEAPKGSVPHTLHCDSIEEVQ